jgi:hypothetical protein
MLIDRHVRAPMRTPARSRTVGGAAAQACSIRCHFAVAKPPLAKVLKDVAFNGTPINETLMQDLSGGFKGRLLATAL